MFPEPARRARGRSVWLFPAALGVCLAVTAVSYAVRELAKPAPEGGSGHRFTAVGFFSASNHVVINDAPPARNAPPGDSVKDVRKLLDDQVAAWNKGDLKGFMAGYWKDEGLTFYSGRDVQKGWQATYDRYHERYQKGGREMGRLTFSDLVIEPLADSRVMVRGRWKLNKTVETHDGLFTLIVRKLPEGWRIVHDHTSAGEPEKKAQ